MPACQFRMHVVDSQIICLTKTSYTLAFAICDYHCNQINFIEPR